MAIKAKVVLMNNQGQCEGWMRELTLPIPPFPGLGIRIDAYEMINVEKVVIEHAGSTVTCFVSPEGPVLPGASPLNAAAFGFQPSANDPQSLASSPNSYLIETMQKRAESAGKRALQVGLFFANGQGFWSKTMEIPFPPFVGLEIHLDNTRILTAWSIVVGDQLHDVTCLATLAEGVSLPSAECEALGFEEALYPY